MLLYKFLQLVENLSENYQPRIIWVKAVRCPTYNYQINIFQPPSKEMVMFRDILKTQMYNGSHKYCFFFDSSVGSISSHQPKLHQNAESRGDSEYYMILVATSKEMVMLSPVATLLSQPVCFLHILIFYFRSQANNFLHLLVFYFRSQASSSQEQGLKTQPSLSQLRIDLEQVGSHGTRTQLG